MVQRPHPVPADEEARLECLPFYDIFGTGPEAEYDYLTRLGAAIFDVPVCLISLIGADEQWLKAHWGVEVDCTARDVSFCTHAILSDEPLVVLDAARDARFRENPLVTGELGVRFYAGAPLINRDGVHLGAFCVIGRTPRTEFSDAERRLLALFATIVSERLDARRTGRTTHAVESFADATALALVTADAAGTITSWNRAAEVIFGHDRRRAIGQTLDLIVPERFRASHGAGLSRLAQGGASTLSGKTVEVMAHHSDGHEFPIELSIAAWLGRSGTEFGAHIQDITDRRAREAELHHLADHDDLTGLLNRSGFRKRLDQCLSEDAAATLLVLDLDGFKGVNDTLGHAVGDALLQMVSLRLTGCAPEDSAIGRIGGDEFAVLITESSDPIAARTVAQQLLDVFAGGFQVAGHDLQIATSIGLAMAPLHAKGGENLLVRADLALLRAKAAGGRRFALFDSGMANQLAARRAFKDEMRTALLEGQWCLHYQPQVRLSDGRLIGAEALLRWDHPVRGLLRPAAFMPVLERHLLAYEVGCWALDEACRQLAIWRGQGFDLPRISVNLFATQLRTGTLEAVVGDALARHGLSPSDLELEITENILLNRDDQAIASLRRLHRTGVAIAFDDFGTGYASLTTLKGFPLSRLKIDRSFVHDVREQTHSAAVVQAVAVLGRTLGLQVIAEGIETPEQAQAIAELGCGEGQGFLYGRPVDGAAFPGWLAQGTVDRCDRRRRTMT